MNTISPIDLTNGRTLIKTYQEFIASKSRTVEPSGFWIGDGEISEQAKPHQRDMIKLACRMGKFCIWSAMGTGKTLIELEWARLVCDRTSGSVLILTPLSVAKQFVREGDKFGISVNLVRELSDVRSGINVCNYESLHKLDANAFHGVILDESSAIKDDGSRTFDQVVNLFWGTPYKLSCSATPSPNDYQELGSQCEFLGIRTRREMLADFFTRDGSDTSKYVLLGHGKRKFWRWVASWAIACNKPSDIDASYDDSLYQLPPLHTEVVEVTTPLPAKENALFFDSDGSLSDQRFINKSSLIDRVNVAIRLIQVNSSDNWIVWCKTNSEAELCRKLIDGAVEIKGCDSVAHKERSIEAFANGEIKVLITKFLIAGHGVNWQHHCNRMIVLDDFNSFEQVFQGTGRIHRFGQEKPVHRYFINHQANARAIDRFYEKQNRHDEMVREMVSAMRERSAELLRSTSRVAEEYKALEVVPIPDWLVSAA